MKSGMQNTVPLCLDLNEVVKQAQQASAIFEHLSLVKVTAENGDTYRRDVETGKKTVAMRGAVVEFDENTISVTVQRPGASIDGTLAETTHLTQTLQGAMVGKNQSTVSRRRNQS